MRSLVRGEPAESGRFYSGDYDVTPTPDPPPGIWFASWGSDRRLAAMAAVADGWFASAYNATPAQYAEARARLDDHLRRAGRAPESFPDAVATTWLHVTESRQEAEHVLVDVLAPDSRPGPGGAEAPADRQRRPLRRGTRGVRRSRRRRGPRLAGARPGATARAVRRRVRPVGVAMHQGVWVVGPHSSPITRPSMVCFCVIGVSSSTTSTCRCLRTSAGSASQ